MKILQVILLLVLLTNCVLPKESRQYRKENKEWRRSELLIFKGYKDGTMSSDFISLYENGKYELETHMMGFTYYRAGNYTINADSLFIQEILPDQSLGMKDTLLFNEEIRYLAPANSLKNHYYGYRYVVDLRAKQ